MALNLLQRCVRLDSICCSKECSFLEFLRIIWKALPRVHIPLKCGGRVGAHIIIWKIRFFPPTLWCLEHSKELESIWILVMWHVRVLLSGGIIVYEGMDQNRVSTFYRKELFFNASLHKIRFHGPVVLRWIHMKPKGFPREVRSSIFVRWCYTHGMPPNKKVADLKFRFEILIEFFFHILSSGWYTIAFVWMFLRWI